MKAVASLAQEIMQLRQQAKELQEQIKDKTDQISTLIMLGAIDHLATEDDAFEIGTIRIKPYAIRRWSYDSATKQQIAEIQEQAQLMGTAEQTVSTSYRFSETVDEGIV